jgi:uncharacterized protein (TIGR02599 family)
VNLSTLPPISGGRRPQGFSLVELLVASVVFLILIGLVLKMTQTTADIWSGSTGKTEGFRDSRMVFTTITKALSQATLNPYFDYADAGGNFRDPGSPTFTPTRYLRRSDLHFVTGKNLLPSGVPNPVTQAVFFQAPLGYSRTPAYADMEGFLNACGFYVSYGGDPAIPSHLGAALPASRQRFRLMQFLQPSENLSIYDPSVTGGQTTWDNTKWFSDALTGSNPPVSQLAENVVALVVHPKFSDNDAVAGAPLSADYEFNSRAASATSTKNQLPPVVEVILVAIDEVSAARLGDSSTPPSLGLDPLFQDTSKLEADVATLEKNLGALPGNPAGNTIPLRYQIFRTEIALRGAKWSTQ